MSVNGATHEPESKYSQEEAQAREETKIIVLESISDMLETAWPQQESHRKKTVKQLLLKWHPDKNTEEDEELATAATQHIHAEVERLEQGVPRHGSYQAPPGGATFDPRNPFSGSPTFQRYFEEAYKQHHEQMNRRRREQQEQRERTKKNFASRTNYFTSTSNPYSKPEPSYSSYTNGASSGSSSTSDSASDSGFTSGSSYQSSGASSGPRPRAPENGHFEYTPHPPSSSYSGGADNPTKVGMMLKQAREDLRSADNDYDVTNPAYEWVCFKSHQAAAKALKAVNLSKNNSKSFSHDLASLAALARDEELKRTATKLQHIIGDNNKLYNLVFVDFDTIPHIEFTRELACDAMMCARDILQRAQEIEGYKDS